MENSKTKTFEKLKSTIIIISSVNLLLKALTDKTGQQLQLNSCPLIVIMIYILIIFLFTVYSNEAGIL